MDFFAVTLLSVMHCLPGQSPASGECRVEKYLYEAHSVAEANEDWAACLIKRDKLLKKYPSVECDQFDPNQQIGVRF